MRFKTLTGAIRTVKKSKNFLIDWDGKSRSKIQFNVKQYLKKYWLKHIVFEEFPEFYDQFSQCPYVVGF